MTEAYLIVDNALASTVSEHWQVIRSSPWDDSGLLFIAIQHPTGGVYDLVLDENGPRLKPDADV